MSDKKQDFWNERAAIGANAGSNDFVLKELELALLMARVPDSASVLDIGCGNGEALLRLATAKNISGTGVDFAEKMVDLAQAETKSRKLDGRLTFLTGKIPGLPADIGSFDIIVTERCLINLDSEAMQKQAFDEIVGHLKPGGLYLMMESFVEGLARTNRLRAQFGLEAISAPWHNKFFHEAVVASWSNQRVRLKEIVPYSSTYHFLSRVIYAHDATARGEEMRYDSNINMMSLKLPVIGDYGPARLYLWEALA
jgi:SAM-dependent methyltransferase